MVRSRSQKDVGGQVYVILYARSAFITKERRSDVADERNPESGSG